MQGFCDFSRNLVHPASFPLTGRCPCPQCLPLFLSPPCSPKIFQKTKCSICNSALELPSVHFLCGHSFHQHCFESYSESDADCPTCLPENRKVMDMIRAQEQKRDLHDQFQHQVGMNGLKRMGDRVVWRVLSSSESREGS